MLFYGFIFITYWLQIVSRFSSTCYRPRFKMLTDVFHFLAWPSSFQEPHNFSAFGKASCLFPLSSLSGSRSMLALSSRHYFGATVGNDESLEESRHLVYFSLGKSAYPLARNMAAISSGSILPLRPMQLHLVPVPQLRLRVLHCHVLFMFKTNQRCLKMFWSIGL